MRVPGLDAKSACVGLLVGICATLSVGAQREGAAPAQAGVADYHVVAELDLVKLKASVKAQGAKGWEAAGGVTFVPGQRAGDAGAFLQAMVLRR